MFSTVARLALIVTIGSAAACAMPHGPTTRSVMTPSTAVADRAYLAELIARARGLDLAHQTGWLRLGHYRPAGNHAGWRSEADGQNFFLAADGKEDPARELEAMLGGLFASVPASDQRPEIQHPACQFPARLRWLDARLGLDRARLHLPPCPRFARFRDDLDAASVTLVFSSYYVSSAASAFGHTFLRVNSRKTAIGEKRELLDYGIDYSADVDTSNSLVYAVKGLLGYFPGRFHRMPYYYKVREYNDYDSRDLWEYELALSPDQLEMLVAHVWELGSTYFDYFYISENCSYHILGALEAAMPARDLLSLVRLPVVPADTVKALMRNPGLVRDVKFRPSLRAQFERRVAELSGHERDLVEELVVRPDQALPGALAPARQLRVLDAAQDLVDIRYAKELPRNPGGEGGRIKQRLGERRAEIALPSDDLVIPTPLEKLPHVGHGSRRIGLGGGVNRAGDAFAVLDLRVTMHDLADSGDGYPDLAQLEFLPTRARLWAERAYRASATDGTTKPDGPVFELDELWLVRIMSLTAQDQFDRKVSWKVGFGMSRIRDEGCASCAAGTVTGGTGAAFASRHGGALVWAMLDARAQWAYHLDGIGPTGFRLGAGPSGGVRLRLGSRLTALVDGGWLWLPTQEPLAAWSVDGTLRWHLFGPLGLDLRATRGNQTSEGWASLLLYQ